jgi:hypothetical protein
MHVSMQSIPAITTYTRPALSLSGAALALCFAVTTGRAAPGDGETPPIWQSAEDGNVSAVAELLGGGTAVDSRGPDGATALHFAAESGFFLANKYSRSFLFFYSIALHMLVFFTMYR